MSTMVIKKRRFNGRRFLNMFLWVMLLVIIMPLFYQSVASGGTEIRYKSVYVQSGDNMWNIASKYTPKGEDVRATISKIKTFNGLDKSAVDPGQEIKIPSDLLLSE